MSSQSNLQAKIREYRRQLLASEAAAANRYADSYTVVWQRLKVLLGSLEYRIAERRKAGEDVSPAWLLTEERYKVLLRQAAVEIDAWCRVVAGEITADQAKAIVQAEHHAESLVSEQLAAGSSQNLDTTWNRLPSDALSHLVGALGDGTPLTDLFKEIGKDAPKALGDALIQGLALGKNPKDIARDLRKAAAIPLDRAIRIARTETLRAARSASQESYQANSDVVECWIWLCDLSKRTCAACIAMCGTEHPLDEPMASHVACRCTMVPKTKTWSELLGPGFEDLEETRPTIPTGEDWLKGQKPDVQAAVLGKVGAAAWRNGQVALKDFVGVRHSDRWGPSVYVKSVSSLTALSKGPGSSDLPGQSSSLPTRDAQLGPNAEGVPIIRSMVFAKAPIIDDLQPTATAIARVHGFDLLSPAVEISSDPNLPVGARGAFRRQGNQQMQIAINPATGPAAQRAATFVHETGHLVDAIIGGISTFASIADPRLDGWRSAIRATDACKKLAAAKKGRSGGILKYLKYLTTFEELFARSYAQYIAMHSGDVRLETWLESKQQDISKGELPSQWAGPDFDAVAREFDDLFLTLGWRK